MHEDIPGIDPHVITHQLDIDPKYHLIKQKQRVFNFEHYEAINMVVDKLLNAGFVKSVDYLT